MKLRWLIPWLFLWIALAGCAGTPPAAQVTGAAATDVPATAGVPVTPSPQVFTDPFAYCAAVGSIDAPDARYGGPQITDEIVRGFLKAAGIEENPDFMQDYRRMTTWRCMDGRVYACNYGANLPCDAKANTDPTPAPALDEFCRQNPGSDFIPMVVTGRETVFSWRCQEEAAVVLEQVSAVDAAGFLETIWYAVEAVK